MVMREPAPLDLNQVEALLRRLSMQRLDPDETIRLPIRYARDHESIILLRCCLLPYLIPLKSERALAYELREREQLPTCVGLQKGSARPTRATLWHFRRRNALQFRQLMRRSLALMLLDAEELGVDLEIRSPIQSFGGHEELVGEDTFHDSEHDVMVKLNFKCASRCSDQTPMTKTLPLFDDVPQDTQHAKLFLYEELNFPVLATYGSGAAKQKKTYLSPPIWLTRPNTDTDIDSYFSEPNVDYTACNIVVLDDDGKKVLLSKRKLGSGAGKFSLPGGKKKEDESVMECVRRELDEEVGLKFIDGRPVSRNWTDRPGYPRVLSLGILATKWEGKVHRSNREHLATTPWEWCSLSELPAELFFPTRMVLDDFLANRFPSLDWTDLDDDELGLPLWRKV